MPITHLDFQQAKANHLLFKSRLRTILHGEATPEESTVISQYACGVGRWLYSHALIAYEAIAEVKELEAVHAAIHTTARELITRYRQGEVEAARQGLIAIEQLADEVVRLLNRVEAQVGEAQAFPTPPPSTTGAAELNQTLATLLAQNERLDAKLNRQAEELDQKEQLFNTIMEASPVVLWLSDSVGAITYVNQTWIEWTGKPFTAHLGGGWTQAIIEEDRGWVGEQFLADLTARRPYAVEFRLRRADGAIRWCSVTGQPWLRPGGDFGGYAGSCIDVTEQVLARQKIEDAEAALRGAVELAQLGTWSIDMATGGLTYSDRLIDWFGYDPGAQPYSEVIPIIQADDQQRVEAAVAWALNPASDGVYNEIYTVIHPKTGQKRILHAQGKTVFDATGKAVRMNGTAQDITPQRELQLVLENQVRERTRQLQESIQDLERSNQSLQQFAYVASHDLQEPLRKIQAFGDILKTQYAGQLGEGTTYLERMQSAAARMSTLINDLLSFSRITTRQDETARVELSEVMETVLTDLELVIRETNAEVIVDPLPTIVGDRSQLAQLFQNLLSNGLKFRRPDQPVVLHVRAGRVEAADLPASVRPTRQVAVYHRLEVADNGIGFEEKYLDRIFEVFQRLHGRNEFAGTGIGLAICEKVVANHGGAITATSRPGQGATFVVYFPA